MTAPQQFILREALVQYPIVQVYVLTRARGVWLPKYLSESGEACFLDVGLNIPNPIRNLTIGVQALEGGFWFKGAPFQVSVPWEAVFRIEVPNVFVTVFAVDNPAEDTTEPEPEKRPSLRLV